MTSLTKGHSASSNTREKDLEYYLSINYPYTVEESLEDGKRLFFLSITDMPGCWAEGETIEEAQHKLQEAKEAWVRAALRKGISIPEPIAEDEFSGKFLLRISPKLHMILVKKAEREGKSLNQYIRSILENRINQHNIQGSFETLAALKLWMQEEFNILSQRICSLETGFNKISSSIRVSQRPLETYGAISTQTDAIDISSQGVLIGRLSQTGTLTTGRWNLGQAFQKEEDAA